MNSRAPTPSNDNAWIGLALALGAAVVSLFWYGRPPGTPRTSEADAATSTNAAASASSGTVPAPPAVQLPSRAATLPNAERDWDEYVRLAKSDPDAARVWLSISPPANAREAQRMKVQEIHAWVRAERVGTARAKAAEYYEKWPDGPDIAELERLTGAHPSR